MGFCPFNGQIERPKIGRSTHYFLNRACLKINIFVDCYETNCSILNKRRPLFGRRVRFNWLPLLAQLFPERNWLPHRNPKLQV